VPSLLSSLPPTPPPANDPTAIGVGLPTLGLPTLDWVPQPPWMQPPPVAADAPLPDVLKTLGKPPPYVSYPISQIAPGVVPNPYDSPPQPATTPTSENWGPR
jgi:hypothetical protein